MKKNKKGKKTLNTSNKYLDRITVKDLYIIYISCENVGRYSYSLRAHLWHCQSPLVTGTLQSPLRFFLL